MEGRRKNFAERHPGARVRLGKQRFFSGVSQWVGVEIEVWRWKAIEFAWFFLLLNVGFGFDSNWGVWGRGEILKEEWKIPNPSFALPS